METIIGLFKAECIRTTVFHDGPYKTLADVEYATAGWVDWYNNRRLHGPLAWSRPWSTSKPTTLPSSPRCSPHESGTKPGTLQIIELLGIFIIVREHMQDHHIAARLDQHPAPSDQLPRHTC